MRTRPSEPRVRQQRGWERRAVLACLYRFLPSLRVVALASVLLAPCGALKAADGTTAPFDAANKLYEQGKFNDAAEAYQNLLKSGRVSSALFFNLGNAYFKGGQMGRAIAAYRSAELLTPRDPDIRANLQFARNQIQGPTLPVPAWQRWLGRLSLNEWTWLGAATLWLWIGTLIAGQCQPALKTALRKFVVLLGITALAVNAGLITLLAENHSTKSAVVIASEATARQGPLDESQTAFTLHDGAELEVLDRKDDWLQVTTDPKRIGWVRREQVLLASQS